MNKFQDKVFPIRLYANYHSGWADELSRKIWMRLKAENREVPVESHFGEVIMTPANKVTWYAVDCEITAPGRVELYVYDMKESFHGGIGKKIISMEVDVPAGPRDAPSAEYQLVQKHIRDREYTIAEDELRRRKEEARIKELEDVHRELFGNE